MVKDIVIIGGGACGVLSAILLAKSGKKVTILEKNSSLAKKITVSGNGRCNISNRQISVKNYHLGDESLVKSVLADFGYEKAKKLFSSLGVEFSESEDGRVFPQSKNAKSVVEVFKSQINSLGIEVLYESEVVGVKRGDDFEIFFNNTFIKAKKLIVCSGSDAYKSVGVSSVGYKIARDFNHSVINLFPSLVQVECSDEKLKRASGVKVNSVVKVVKNGVVLHKAKGDLLFTNYGLSGLAILDSSFYLASLKSGVYLEIDLMPEFSLEELNSLFKRRLKLKDVLDFDSWLGAVIDKKLIPLVAKEKVLNQKSIKSIAYNIKNLKVKVDNVRDKKYAEIIAGGVETSEINPKTLESKKVKNLFFGGEILNVCGDRGGYNLHFAFGCAYKITHHLQSLDS